MVRFAAHNRELLSEFDLIATGSTGSLVEATTGMPIQCLRHGPKGGDVQIAADVLAGRIAAVFFFTEPMDVHPHDPDIQTLVRICNIENVPIATNPATAALVIQGLAQGDDPQSSFDRASRA
jgi:methylglyoxal synthase